MYRRLNEGDVSVIPCVADGITNAFATFPTNFLSYIYKNIKIQIFLFVATRSLVRSYQRSGEICRLLPYIDLTIDSECNSEALALVQLSAN
jgi:hypothetical protein